MKGQVLDVLAALITIGAGAYLLQAHSADVTGLGSGQSWFEVIAHGMGAYFVGRGVYGLRAAYLADKHNDLLTKMVDATPRVPRRVGDSLR